MTQLKGSWKKHFDYRFLAGEDFDNKVIEMTIAKVSKEESFNPRSKRNEKVMVLYFTGTDKGIILNLTNLRDITNLLKTDILEEWEGKKVPFWGMPDKKHGQVIRVKKNFSNLKM